MKNFPRVLTGGFAALAIATGLAGCAPSADSPETSDGLQIVVTTTQLTDFTENVTAGTGAEIVRLLPPNTSAHSFEANAADLEAIRTADVFILNGLGLEPWVESTLDAAGFDGLVIDASTGISEADIVAGNEEVEGEHAEDEHAEDEHAEDEHAEDEHSTEEPPVDEHASDEHAAEEHPEEEHAEEEGAAESHDGHDHGEHNPHLWTSPMMAGDMTTEVANQLASLDAANGETYLANASAYVDELALLDEWITENMATVPAADRLLVSNHDALTYYNHDYGITFVGSVMPSWDDSAEPSAAEIDALVAAIQEAGVPAIFTEAQLRPATADAIAKEAGVKVYSGDEALYTDALGAEDSTGATYIQSTIHNTTQLLDSWGATVTEAPAEIQES